MFAPGKTPIESLRELLSAPYDTILPARFHRLFAASIKFTFTRDGDPDIPVIEGSLFNVVVTNTEKIRIRKETIRKRDVGLVDVPEKKTDDYVEGRYELAVPKGKTTVAVRITDMLGEEVLVTKTV